MQRSDSLRVEQIDKTNSKAMWRVDTYCKAHHLQNALNIKPDFKRIRHQTHYLMDLITGDLIQETKYKLCAVCKNSCVMYPSNLPICEKHTNELYFNIIIKQNFEL